MLLKIHSKNYIGHFNIALYVRRWVFILYVGEFLQGRKQFKGDILRVEVFVSPVWELESLGFAFIPITYDDSRRHKV
jgi:hypothetical protein